MAHFAQLDESNVVTQVIVIHNNEIKAGTSSSIDENGYITVSSNESELNGINFCKNLFGTETKWVQTSYSGSFRGKFASIGDTFNTITQTFVSPNDVVIDSQTEETPNSNVESITNISQSQE